MLLFALPERHSSVTHSYHTCSQITVISCGSTWTELYCWHECKVYHNVDIDKTQLRDSDVSCNHGSTVPVTARIVNVLQRHQ